VTAKFQMLTSEGTPTDLIENAATILGVDKSKIGYRKLSEHGVVELAVPGKGLSTSSLSETEFVSIIGRQSAAGFRVEATVRGTFTYVTPETYKNDNMDPERGYTSLDSDDNPKSGGGTYAGLIE